MKLEILLLSTTEYVLTMDMLGPIVDNVGGIVEMSQQVMLMIWRKRMSVRERTDVLDAIGDITKATTKGFATGFAALASFLALALFFLFSAYTDEACAAVGRTTQEIVNEDYKEKPNYSRCVSIIVSASLRVIIKPGALAIISPTIGGDWST
ncbi:hypothetical protein FXO37_27336 [Capsicum annuum]|nr:hypothetical protein FXO37_27336 [Capsicum annuum]